MMESRCRRDRRRRVSRSRGHSLPRSQAHHASEFMTEPNDEEVITIRCTLDGEEIQLSRAAASRAEFLRDMMEDTARSTVLPVELAAPPVCLVAEILKHRAAVAAGTGGEAAFPSLADVTPEALMDAMEAAHHLDASEAFAALAKALFPAHGGAGRCGSTAPDARRARRGGHCRGGPRIDPRRAAL